MTMGRSDYDQTRAGAYNHRDNLAAGADVYGSDNEKIGTLIAQSLVTKLKSTTMPIASKPRTARNKM